MNEIYEVTSSIISYWNDFAEKNGYQKQEKNNDVLRRKVRTRLLSDESFLHKMPHYFDLIHKNCGRRNEFGNDLTLFQFLRASTILRALIIENKGEKNG